MPGQAGRSAAQYTASPAAGPVAVNGGGSVPEMPCKVSVPEQVRQFGHAGNGLLLRQGGAHAPTVTKSWPPGSRICPRPPVPCPAG